VDLLSLGTHAMPRSRERSIAYALNTPGTRRNRLSGDFDVMMFDDHYIDSQRPCNCIGPAVLIPLSKVMTRSVPPSEKRFTASFVKPYPEPHPTGWCAATMACA
jgi:hypothetical protein